MSRIGRLPVAIPAGVTVDIQENNHVVVKLSLIHICGGRKPWRQKGTGHARQGSTRAPQWTGGGVVFAPVPRDYSFKMNKKEKRAALKRCV